MANGARFGARDLVRVWSSAAAAGRSRRPTDALLLVLAVLLLVLGSKGAPGPGNFDQGVSALLAALPAVASLLWQVAYTAVTIWAVVLLVLPVFFRGRRALSGTLLLAALIALAGSIVAGAGAGMQRGDVWASLLASPDTPVYPAARIAVAAAIIVTASPWVTRPLRVTGRILVALGAVGVVGLGAAWAGGALAAVVLGVAAAAVTHLVLGSPQGLLTAEQVEIALQDLGIEASGAQPLPDGPGGEAMWRATTADGRDLRVRVLGRDAWNSQFLGSVWTALTRRGERLLVGRGRTARIEHEALATLLAARQGVPVLEPVVVGSGAQGDAVIATAAPTGVLFADRVDGDAEATDDHMREAWRALTALHAVGMAHGRVAANAVVRRGDGTVALADFADADLHAGSADVQVDRVRLLTATALASDTDRALRVCREVLGDDEFVELLPYLQGAVLGRGQRRRLRDADWTMNDLQRAAVSLAEVSSPPLQQVRRVSARSIAIVAIVALMGYTLASALAGVDLSSVVEALSSAQMSWLILAVALSPLVQACFAFSTLGSTMRRLRYVAVLMLQYAIQFIALCLPSTAARLALEVRFFERFGLPAATAIGIGMVDSFSGFLVQIALILLIVVSGLPAFTTSVGSSGGGREASTSDPGLLLVVVVFTVIALIVTFAVPRLRHRLLGSVPRIRARVAEQRRNAGDALTVVRHPRKVMTMLAGNLGAQVMQAIILGVCLLAFGQTAHLSQLILINTAVSLFAGLMPVPGGMGVAEAGYTAGLQAVGVPAAEALSAALAFRLATFYLPPLWGSIAMRWLRRHEYI